MREWLNELPREDKRTVGRDIAKVQFGWPVRMPLCQPLSGGLWEDTLLAAKQARGAGVHRVGMLVALHAIIKKGRKAPADDLAQARERLKELKSW